MLRPWTGSTVRRSQHWRVRLHRLDRSCRRPSGSCRTWRDKRGRSAPQTRPERRSVDRRLLLLKAKFRFVFFTTVIKILVKRINLSPETIHDLFFFGFRFSVRGRGTRLVWQTCRLRTSVECWSWSEVSRPWGSSKSSCRRGCDKRVNRSDVWRPRCSEELTEWRCNQQSSV